MTARTTLVELIAVLRGMTNAGTADWASGTVNYWDDDQAQLVLDRYRRDHFRAAMTAVESYGGGGTVQWKNYYSGIEHLEQTSGGTAVFYLEDAAGAKVGTALYTMDYGRGAAEFAANTGGSSYFLYGRSYDLNRAAADIWRQKASYYAGQFDFSTDNQRIGKGSVYQHCLKMADYYESRASEMSVVEIWRSDVEPLNH